MTEAPRRRRASQARSKVTVQRILDATTALIIERGADGVTMSEIAKRSDLVIGSLYQYFTDKTAIYRAILIKHSADARALLHHFVSEVKSVDDLTEALSLSFDAYFALLQKDRLVIGLWSIVQIDSELQAFDLEDTLVNARYVANVASPILPGVRMNRLVATCFILIQFSLYASQLARNLPAELSQEFPATYKSMLRDTIASLRRAKKE